jgi:hypothetical protein
MAVPFKRLVEDRASTALLTGFAITLLMALLCAPTESKPRIPARSLDRLRGANPDYYQVEDAYGDCSAWNAYLLSGGGTNYIAAYNCSTLNVNTPCILCNVIFNYDLVAGTGVPSVFPKPIEAVDCNNPPGFVGTCQISTLSRTPFCSFTGGINCTQYVRQFRQE